MYLLIKYWARSALQVYCAHIDRKGIAAIKGRPTILTANHPNSFFDAIVIGAYHPQPISFLARGDAFTNPMVAKLLRMLWLIPIYRLSEGKDSLSKNEASFTECLEILKRNGTLLIFSEGLCINEWKLRSLKKGTARLVYRALTEAGLHHLAVQPVGINYQSFTEVPKHIWLSYGDAFAITDFDIGNEAHFYQQFNAVLTDKFRPLVMNQSEVGAAMVQCSKQPVLKFLLSVPAFAGYVLHRWLYVLLRDFVRKKTEGTVFYDAVLFSSLLLIYSALVPAVTVVMVVSTGNIAFAGLLLALPATAWSYSKFKSL